MKDITYKIAKSSHLKKLKQKIHTKNYKPNVQIIIIFPD